MPQEKHDKFLEALANQRDELIAFYHPQMAGMPERYVFTADCPSGVFALNADYGDPDCYYTLAKNAVDHLRRSLLGLEDT